MGYCIYLITSPKGKVYVGLTSTAIKKRWGNHVRRAFYERRNHPLYNAIRKYGEAGFCIDRLRSVDSKIEAAQAEQEEIHRLRAEWPGFVMNISDGGETDGACGAQVFWDRYRSDAAYRREYTNKLKTGCKNRDASLLESLVLSSKRWREANPREAYRLARRGIRIANRAAGVSMKTDPPVGPIRVSPKAAAIRESKNKSAAAKRIWAGRDEQTMAEVGRKISAGLRKYFENTEARAGVTTQLVEARKSIDREKQAAAASAGQKAWWAEIKKDSKRYAEYIARRKTSLLQTLEEKKCASELTTSSTPDRETDS